MQPVPRAAARPSTLPLPCALVASALRTSRTTAAGVASPTKAAAALRAQAQRDGRADPPVAVARRDDGVELAGEEKDGDFLAPEEEELELLEDEAMRGADDEGRSPTDYDRRARIFQESSRLFRDLKQRRDGHGHGDASAGARAARHG